MVVICYAIDVEGYDRRRADLAVSLIHPALHMKQDIHTAPDQYRVLAMNLNLILLIQTNLIQTKLI